MGLLSRDQILSADDLPTRDIAVPEWGGTVRLRTLTGAERDAFEADSIQQKGGERKVNLYNARARLLSLCIVDDNGGRIFSDSDVKALGRKSSRVMDRLVEECQKLNRISESDMDELTEGLDNAQSDSSTSD